jgi:hypothetical protein
MQPIKTLAVVGSFIAAGLVTLAFTGALGSRVRTRPGAAAGPGFAVVELFTSEGCSSCPPADELVARVQQEDKDRPVYLLAFHVDYWNRLGWTDVFSKTAYSDRQRQYASWLNLQSVYTPQIVVNGRKEFVGSDASTLRSTIEKDLQGQTAPARLSISHLKREGDQLEWGWQTEGVTKNLSLVVALVQRSAVTNVRAGENGGHTLSHVQIVRNFQTSSLKGRNSGAGHMDWPAGVKPGEAEVIVFLQNEDNGEIVAATRSGVAN